MNSYDVRQMRQVALVLSQVAVLNARIEGMKAINVGRQTHGYSLAYEEDAFEKVIQESGLEYNDVLTTLNA